MTYRASATIRYDHEMDGVDSSAVTSHLFYVAIQYADGTINRVATGTVKAAGRRLLSQVSSPIPSDANVEGSKLIVETAWGAEGTCMDYVIDDISLIGLADEKEYPVAEEYEPNGSNLDLVLGMGT